MQTDQQFAGLNAAQVEAVAHVEGPLLVLAGPGSGKTRVITHRIAHLIQSGIAPSEILALTFTNKAADEMKARVGQLAPGASVWVGTFHRFCAQLLRKYAAMVGLESNYTIYDVDDAGRALRRAMAAAGIAQATPDAVRNAISWAKNNLISAEAYKPRAGNALGLAVAEVYPVYQSLLMQANAVDFDDLLLHVAMLLRANRELRAQLDRRWRFILVDEYQDTNLAQYAIARALSIDYPNLAATGDPDQSIYGWRGANLNNILEFERDFPEVRVVRLEQNYRSTQRILSAADCLISHNVKRKRKGLFPDKDSGAPVRLAHYGDQHEEARKIAEQIAAEVRGRRRRPREFAVFYRINALSRELERAMREYGVPYQIVRGVEFFQRKEIRDLVAYLQLVHNPRNDVALLRIINTPTRGIGKTTVNRISQHARQHGLTLLEAVRQADRIETLSKRARRLVAEFAAIIDRLDAGADAAVEELVGRVLDATHMRELFEESPTEEDRQRLANLEELLTVARQFDERHQQPGGLEAFLEEASLVNDTDDWEAEHDRVTLMTLHASKGLEFPVVFVVALEQGLLPHERSLENFDQLEEERRLLFVGMTRAMEQLQLSLARRRDFRGQRKLSVPSPFLFELPREEMVVEENGQPTSLSAPGSAAIDTTYAQVEPGGGQPAVGQAAKAAGAVAGKAIGLTTAAELAGESPAGPVDPEVFRQGMVVRHPKFGLGRIVALSGQGPQRKATVEFSSQAGSRKFVLAKSDLRPVRK